MTQNTKTQKTQKNANACFCTKCKINRNGNICVLCHNFWSNQDVDLLSTSKWPSEPQFCERWTYIWQKRARYGRSKYKGHSFLYSLYVERTGLTTFPLPRGHVLPDVPVKLRALKITLLFGRWFWFPKASDRRFITSSKSRKKEIKWNSK